ncbi:MAG: DNA-binding protein WhiA [Oscillospiraceae bacterium]|nr:DNA-binding protein WhiA [Oscillospiraceae bacterium]
MSYSNKVKDLLRLKKERKKCCKTAFIYGLSINSKESNSLEFINCKINHDIFVCENCKHSFFRGLFLSSGSISDPKDAYHLEFTIHNINTALDLQSILEEENIFLKYVERRKNHVLYLKSSEQIEDFLYYINAEKISFELMDVKILKDLRNNANRITNFENANLEKMSRASAEQIEAINSLIASGRFDLLPDELKRTAELRLENIEMSLQEIGEACEPAVTKSAIKHRMERIVKFAGEM